MIAGAGWTDDGDDVHGFRLAGLSGLAALGNALLFAAAMHEPGFQSHPLGQATTWASFASACTSTLMGLSEMCGGFGEMEEQPRPALTRSIHTWPISIGSMTAPKEAIRRKCTHTS